MYLTPSVKSFQTLEGKISLYDIDIVIDENVSYKIFKEAQNLKTVLVENGCGINRIVKLSHRTEHCIFLTCEDQLSQKYTIRTEGNCIVICGESERALFWGMQTMKQIIAQEPVFLPCFAIEDEPTLQERGSYLDVTRGRVPTLAFLKEYVDKLAFYKYTNMQLYMEHTFQWKGFEEINLHRGYLTAEEILELDQYCQDKYIELIPSIASCGHLYNLLQAQSYQKYAEMIDYEPTQHHWQEFRLHHVIDTTNPESFELITSLYDQIIPLFSSKKFNICCDETVDLGMGRGKETADAIGKGQMYLNWINQLAAYLAKRGKEVMIWGDILLEHMDYVSLLPKNVTILPWTYTAPLKTEEMIPLLETGLKCQLCPQTGTAVTFVPSYSGERGWIADANIRETVALAVERNAEGVLVTTWGDFGQTCPHELTYPMLAYCGALCWNDKGIDDIEEFDRYISTLEFGAPETMRILKEFSTVNRHVWDRAVRRHISITTGVDAPCMKPIDNAAEKYQKICDLENQLIAQKITRNQELLLNCVKAERLLTALDAAYNTPVMPHKELATRLEQWFEEYADIWRRSNKEAELYRIYDMIAWYCRELRNK